MMTDGMSIKSLCDRCHSANKEWWIDINTGEPIIRNKGELIALMHSELSEALEGIRKNLADDKLPNRSMEEVELADLLIRVFDYAGGFNIDLDGAFWAKMIYNSMRKDHTHEHRLSEHGKKF